MTAVRQLIKNIVVFLAALLVCALLLSAVIAAIPRHAIAEQSRASSDYFSTHDGFPMLIEGVEGSRLDNYADIALLDVIYCADSAEPFASMIGVPYYRNDGQDIREDFHAAVYDGAAPNNEYSRYWHGSQVLLRPLLVFTDIQGCRAVLFALFCVLNIMLAVLLVRCRAWTALVSYFAALVLVQFWAAAFTLEYVMVLLVMNAACISVVWLRDKDLTPIFVISGVVTCFMDFLTAETLSFTIPAILALMLLQKADTFKDQILRLIKWGCGWLISYAATFAVKWALAYAVSGEAAWKSTMESAALRIDGQTLLPDGTIDTVTPLTALVRNLACLWPFANENATVTGVLLTAMVVLLVLLAVLYLFRGEGAKLSYMVPLLLVGLLPYLRYILIYSHAHVHYFFTYRAQMAFIMALIAVCVHALHDSPLWRKKSVKAKGGGRR